MPNPGIDVTCCIHAAIWSSSRLSTDSSSTPRGLTPASEASAMQPLAINVAISAIKRDAEGLALGAEYLCLIITL